jgi:hypothetical protein
MSGNFIGVAFYLKWLSGWLSNLLNSSGYASDGNKLSLNSSYASYCFLFMNINAADLSNTAICQQNRGSFGYHAVYSRKQQTSTGTAIVASGGANK